MSTNYLLRYGANSSHLISVTSLLFSVPKHLAVAAVAIKYPEVTRLVHDRDRDLTLDLGLSQVPIQAPVRAGQDPTRELLVTEDVTHAPDPLLARATEVRTGLADSGLPHSLLRQYTVLAALVPRATRVRLDIPFIVNTSSHCHHLGSNATLILAPITTSNPRTSNHHMSNHLTSNPRTSSSNCRKSGEV